MSDPTNSRGPAFVDVYHATDHAELATVRLVLDNLGVRYFVKNEFASQGSLVAIGPDELAVMVEAGRASECASAIREAVE